MTLASGEDIQFFNNRIINPDTIDGILRVCDDLNIPDSIEFIAKFATADQVYTNPRLPEFMRTTNPLFKYSNVLDIMRYRAIQYIYKYISNNRFRFIACNAAIRYNHLDILKYLHLNGCPLFPSAFIIARRHNYTAILNYLTEYFDRTPSPNTVMLQCTLELPMAY